MSTTSNDPTTVYSLTMTQKSLYAAGVVVLVILLSLGGNMLQGLVGTVIFLLIGASLGVAGFFVSSGWSFKLEVTPDTVRVTDTRRRTVTLPLEKVGMLVKNGGFPFPTYWLVAKNFSEGVAIPAKGVDPQTRAMIDAYQKRNPGKQLSIVPLPGGYVRSAKAFAEEMKRRIPPLTLDERVSK